MKYVGQTTLKASDGWVKLSDRISNFKPKVGDYYNFDVEGSVLFCMQDEKPNEDVGLKLSNKFGYNVTEEVNVWVKALFFNVVINID